jgi:hypothetical protein
MSGYESPEERKRRQRELDIDLQVSEDQRLLREARQRAESAKLLQEARERFGFVPREHRDESQELPSEPVTIENVRRRLFGPDAVHDE